MNMTIDSLYTNMTADIYCLYFLTTGFNWLQLELHLLQWLNIFFLIFQVKRTDTHLDKIVWKLDECEKEVTEITYDENKVGNCCLNKTYLRENHCLKLYRENLK